MSKSDIRATNLHLKKEHSSLNHESLLSKVPNSSNDSVNVEPTSLSRRNHLLKKSRAAIPSEAATQDKLNHRARFRSNDDNGNDRKRSTSLPRRLSFAEYKNSVCSLLNDGDDTEEENKREGFRAAVTKAVQNNKIFAVHPRYTSIRKALEKRGWVEKRNFEFTSLTNRDSSSSLASLDPDSSDEEEDDEDRSWVEAQLRNYQPDFIFKYWRDKIDWDLLLPHQSVNQNIRNYFTTKTGIAACSQQLQWHSEPSASFTNFCRCYRLCNEEEREAFVKDYRLCACVAMLRWIIDHYESYGDRGIVGSNDATETHLELNSLKFAVKQIYNYVKFRKHEDIDKQAPFFAATGNLTWDNFLVQYHNLIAHGLKLSPDVVTSALIAKKVVQECSKCLEKLKPYWPQTELSGTHNVWIVKPGAQSRGKGIVVMNQLEKMLNYHLSPDAQKLNWVVQKYIERPVLIYGTKFDIRQWFLVTDWHPLTVWFYRDSYLRFCTTPFDIEDFHESVHLCNNQVQCRYDNFVGRNMALPEDNMWSNLQFKEYLKGTGEGDIWDTKIYPGMKQGILGILRASQDIAEIPYRKNCFEVYGADFLLSEDFTPWLIEINMSPCLDKTSKVTEEMCPRCLEDCVKVVLDLRKDPTAETGSFELIFKQPATLAGFEAEATVFDVVVEGRAVPPSSDVSADIKATAEEEFTVTSGNPNSKHQSKSVRINDGNGANGAKSTSSHGFTGSPTETVQADTTKGAADSYKTPFSAKQYGSSGTVPKQMSTGLDRNKFGRKELVFPPTETQTVAQKMADWRTWSTTSVVGGKKASRNVGNLNSQQPAKIDGSSKMRPDRNVSATKMGSKSQAHVSKSNVGGKANSQKSTTSVTRNVRLVGRPNENQPKLPRSITESVNRHIFGHSIAKSVRLQPPVEEKPSAQSGKSPASARKGEANNKPGSKGRSGTAIAAKNNGPTSATSVHLGVHRSAVVFQNFAKPRRTDAEISKSVKSTAQISSKHFNGARTRRPSSTDNAIQLPNKTFRLPLAVDSTGFDHNKMPSKILPTTARHTRPTVLPNRSRSRSFSDLKTTSLNKIAQAENRKKAVVTSSTFAKSVLHSSVHIPKSLASAGSRPTSNQSYPTAKPVTGPPVEKLIEKIAAPMLSSKDVKQMVKSMFKDIISESSRSFHSIVVTPTTLKQRASSRFAAITARPQTSARRSLSRKHNNKDTAHHEKKAPPAL